MSNISPTARLLAGLFACLFTLSLLACQDHRLPQPGQIIQPTGPKPDWGPTIGPQMQAVIEELGRLSPTPLNELTPQQARLQTVLQGCGQLTTR